MRWLKNFAFSYKNVFYLYQLSWHYDRKYVFYLIFHFIFSTVDPFILMIFPKLILDEVIERGSLGSISIYMLVMFFMLMCTKNGLIVTKQRGELEGEYLMIQLRLLCNKINMTTQFENMENTEFLDQRERAGQIIWNSTYFNSLAFSFANLLAGIFQLVGILFIIVTIKWELILVLLLLFTVNVYCQIIIQQKNHKIDKETSEVRRKWNYLDSVMSDFKYAKIIRIELLTDWLIGKSKENRNVFYKKQAMMIHNNTLVAMLGTVLSCIQEIIVYIYLIYKVIYSNMEIGSFYMYLVAVNQFSTALNTILTSTITMNRYGLYMNDFKKFLTSESDVKDENERSIDKITKLSIEFRDVSFRYPRTEKWILRHINLAIHEGEKITLVGDNGAGKTTLIKLLMRFYNPTEGQILLNAIDIREYEYSQYQRMIATVFQDYKIFSFTLAENIVMDDMNCCNEEKLNRVIEQSDFQTVVNKLDANIDTYMGKKFEESGIELSGGEQQKLSIARALYQEAPIMILDEPTANLSPIAEYDIYMKYNEMTQNKTTIFVSHRLSSSQFSDKVVFLSNGIIAEYGSHKSLLEQNGLYAEMFRLQAQYYND